MYRVDSTQPAEEDLLAALRYVSEALKAPEAARNLLPPGFNQVKP
jgi:hypothetical protein